MRNGINPRHPEAEAQTQGKVACSGDVHRPETESFVIYKRRSGHRGRNPNLITSGPSVVDSIFKMTGGRDGGCDVTLRRRLKPY